MLVRDVIGTLYGASAPLCVLDQQVALALWQEERSISSALVLQHVWIDSRGREDPRPIFTTRLHSIYTFLGERRSVQ